MLAIRPVAAEIQNRLTLFTEIHYPHTIPLTAILDIKCVCVTDRNVK
jgi:hypothetical protein